MFRAMRALRITYSVCERVPFRGTSTQTDSFVSSFRKVAHPHVAAQSVATVTTRPEEIIRTSVEAYRHSEPAFSLRFPHSGKSTVRLAAFRAEFLTLCRNLEMIQPSVGTRRTMAVKVGKERTSKWACRVSQHAMTIYTTNV